MVFSVLLFELLITLLVTEILAMDVQQCTKTGLIPDRLQVTIQYAPSTIACSFICKDNPDCKTFSFSGNTCFLYWANTSQIVSYGGSASMVSCTDVKIVCPQKIDAGKLTCTYSENHDSCYCISSIYRNWTDAMNTCNLYGMKLISVETLAKHSFIANFINSYIVSGNASDIWTSGQRQGSNKWSFLWESTGTPVDFRINNSSNIDFSGNCLTYLWDNGTSVWNDRYVTDAHRFLCEFQLQ